MSLLLTKSNISGAGARSFLYKVYRPDKSRFAMVIAANKHVYLAERQFASIGEALKVSDPNSR